MKPIANWDAAFYDSDHSHYYPFLMGSDATAVRNITWNFGDAARTITVNGDPTLNDWFDQSVKQAASPTFGGVTLGNLGLRILDTNASHDLILAPGSDLTADRTLTVTTGDSDRTLTLNGDPTLNDWFDQSVKQAASPTFGGLTVDGDLRLLADGQELQFGAAQDYTVQYDGSDAVHTVSTGDFVFSGGNVGIGTTEPDGALHVYTASAGSVTAGAYADDLVIENSAETGISILSPDALSSYLRFGSPSDNSGAQIHWNYDNALLTVGTALPSGELQFTIADGGNAIRIDNTGNVGIGTTTPNEKLEVSGNIRLTTDANLLQFGAVQDYTVQYDGDDAVHTVSSGQFRFVGGNIELEDSIDANAGVIMKGSDPWMHNYVDPDGGGSCTPYGDNLFLGINAGNLTVGSTASEDYQASRNVGIGTEALTALTYGFQNFAGGYRAGYALTTGQSNMYFGYESGSYNASGSYNVCIGSQAGKGASGASNYANNTLLGYQAGKLVQTAGSNNILVGYKSGDNLTTGANNIIIGYDLEAPAVDTSYHLNIGGVIRGNLTGGSETVDIGAGTTNYARFADDGLLSLAGTARVTKSQWMDAGAIKAPGVKPATEVAHGSLETPAWSFGDEGVEANEETISWSMQIPADCDRSVAPILNIGWSADGANPGVCEWQLEYRWIALGEDTGAAAQETLYADDSGPATADGLVMTAFAGIDLPESTDRCIHCRLKRLSSASAGNQTDTISIDVHVHGVCMQYTSNKLGTGL